MLASLFRNHSGSTTYNLNGAWALILVTVPKMLGTKITSSLAQMVGAFVLMLAFASVGMCQTSQVEEAEPDSSESIEEITVYGDKPMPTLRREVYKAEGNFFDLFSSLNDHDEFDVRCYYEVPSFTHIRRHVCRANFVIEATSAASAPAFFETPGAFARPAVYTIRRKKERMRELMEAMVAEHPELAQALTQYADTKQVLESEKTRRYGQ
jgi:hypothetical protein